MISVFIDIDEICFLCVIYQLNFIQTSSAPSTICAVFLSAEDTVQMCLVCNQSKPWLEDMS